jgi:glycosyltransferase involved in cell wall biosynthesis
MYGVSRWLSEKNDVSVITGDWGQPATSKFGNIIVYASSKLGGKNYFGAALKLWQTLKSVNAEIYIASAAGAEIGIIALFCKMHKKRFIYRSASDVACNGEYIHKHGLIGKIFKYGLEHADYIVTCNKSHIANLEKFHHIPRKIMISANLALVVPEKKISQLHKDSVLWVSRCIPIKRPEIFINLAKDVSKQKFTMICPKQYFEADYFNKVKKMAEKVKNIEFHDYIPSKSVGPYYDRAKVVINTSDFEGFTYTLIEAGVAGTPVLYLRVNPDNVITKYNIGYCSNGDTNDLRAKLSTLLTNSTDWKEKSANIEKYVRENHDIRSVGEKWDKAIAFVEDL